MEKRTRPTIREIAEISGVSPSTASRVLAGGAARALCNDATAAHVEHVAKELGYRVNYHMRSVRTGRSFAIGFGIEATKQEYGGQAGSWYFEQLHEGVASEAQANGMNLLMVRPDAGRTAFHRGMDYLADRRLDALVIPQHYAARDPGAAAAAAAGSAAVVTVDGVAGVGFPHVGFDAQAGLTLLVQHLQSLGHRRVLWFGPLESEPPEPEGREQFFLRAAFSAGLVGKVRLASPVTMPRLETDHVLNSLLHDLAEPLSQFGAERITAVVAYNDIYAIAAERAVLQAGFRIPDDVSVAGFDDSYAAFGFPPITTVSHELFNIGQEAGRIAIKLVEARSGDRRQRKSRRAKIPTSRMIEPKLIVRQSTGPARSSD